jgi:hypothetical protein
MSKSRPVWWPHGKQKLPGARELIPVSDKNQYASFFVKHPIAVPKRTPTEEFLSNRHAGAANQGRASTGQSRR